MISETQRLTGIALAGRVLGVLFYRPPDEPECAKLLTMLANPGWDTQWPVQPPGLADIAHRITHGIAQPQEPLREAYQRLFIGPYALPAPPWGSVYLDRENVLFGDSMLALRQWMRQHGIAQQSGKNEPLDNFGILVMLAAWLAEQGLAQRLDELLAWHLFPWSDRFLTLFTRRAGNEFYQGLGELAQLTLNAWREGMLTPVAPKELYF